MSKEKKLLKELSAKIGKYNMMYIPSKLKPATTLVAFSFEFSACYPLVTCPDDLKTNTLVLESWASTVRSAINIKAKAKQNAGIDCMNLSTQNMKYATLSVVCNSFAAVGVVLSQTIRKLHSVKYETYASNCRDTGMKPNKEEALSAINELNSGLEKLQILMIGGKVKMDNVKFDKMCDKIKKNIKGKSVLGGDDKQSKGKKESEEKFEGRDYVTIKNPLSRLMTKRYMDTKGVEVSVCGEHFFVNTKASKKAAKLNDNESINRFVDKICKGCDKENKKSAVIACFYDGLMCGVVSVYDANNLCTNCTSKELTTAIKEGLNTLSK